MAGSHDSASVAADDLSKDVLTEVLIKFHEKRISQLQRVNEMPIYPTEDIIWDDGLVPDEYTLTSGKPQCNETTL